MTILLYRQINLSLSSISPLLAGKINHLELDNIIFNCTRETLLVNSLTSPHSSLRMLDLSDCTFLSAVYNRLIATIATSQLTYFAVTNLHIDVTRAKVLATLLVDSKTLEEVEVIEYPTMNKDVAVILAEAMSYSSVKKLTMGDFSKGTVLGCHYPTDRVNLKCW